MDRYCAPKGAAAKSIDRVSINISLLTERKHSCVLLIRL
jgi:hypothetical protein